ncbi:MAG: hypothetical protein EOP05_10640 [Proteobacteria bacterium]|nr:MAG: hypothetical protein EOP05_10640 [Pseudomonadota bacterium]
MASEKKLPAVFYALMFAAIAVALVLIVGIIMEKKNEAPSPVATATPAASASPSEALAKTCTLKEVSLAPALEFMKSARLVGWGAEPFQLTLWVLDRSKEEAPVAKKLTLSNLQAESAKAEVTSQQPLACEGFQKAGCLYLASSETNGTRTPADTVTDLSLERDLGLLTLSSDPKNSRAVVARVENGKLMFHETLGLEFVLAN